MRDKLGENLRQKMWDEYQPDSDAVPDDQPESPRPLASKLGQWVGGLVSLALVLALVYWVFELGRRDANEVPVIQAMGGLARVVPEDSGGTVVEHQGLQVNEVLGGNETAPIEAETRLAPPPQRVVAADAPPPTPATTPIPQTTAAVPLPQTATAFILPPSLPGADPNMRRPTRRTPVSSLSPNADILSQAIASAISEVANEGAASTTPSPPPAPTTPPAAAQFSGERMIQLGAYDDEPSAIKDWEALVAENQDLMGNLTRFVERREAGGRVFYRLRARGFADMQAATDLCTALLARDVPCIAVTAR